jgi:hypothetical protein
LGETNRLLRRIRSIQISELARVHSGNTGRTETERGGDIVVYIPNSLLQLVRLVKTKLIFGTNKAAQGGGSLRNQANVIGIMLHDRFKAGTEQGDFVIQTGNPRSLRKISFILAGKHAGIIAMLTSILVTWLTSAVTNNILIHGDSSTVIKALLSKDRIYNRT